MRTLADIVAFNAAQRGKALRFGQDLFLAASKRPGAISTELRIQIGAGDGPAGRPGTRGIDAYMDQHKLDAVLFPGAAGAAIAAKPGYPSVRCRGASSRGSATRRRRTIRSASTSPAAPGASQAAAPRLRLRAGFPHARPPPGLLAL